MDDTAVEWLRQEALDELIEDDMGVYELLWALRGSDYYTGDSDGKELVRHVVKQLLSTGETRLIHLKWASDDPVQDGVQESELDDDHAFEFSPDGTYLALSALDSK